jgi:molybdopterin biosynthesis enzyme MoaB
VTPEATKEIVEKEVPGIPEIIRIESYKITHRAMLSRGNSGIRGNTLIINLPGSPKAVKESLDVIIPALNHGIEVLRGEAHECAEKWKDK